MPNGAKAGVFVLAIAGIVSTPLVWLLNGPGPGALVGASVQGTVGIAALVWALWQGAAGAGPHDEVIRGGEAISRQGGTAVSGIRRPRGRGHGDATVRASGKATAVGEGASAVTGVDYS
ncbi:hypothetical protein OG277_41745 [Streptomyces phaeochromogenes]|nr:hypothetical protein OG277_41745 [Streptomyces phaeochromogenes]